MQNSNVTRHLRNFVFAFVVSAGLSCKQCSQWPEASFTGGTAAEIKIDLSQCLHPQPFRTYKELNFAHVNYFNGLKNANARMNE